MIIELLSQINQQPFLTRAQLKSTVDVKKQIDITGQPLRIEDIQASSDGTIYMVGTTNRVKRVVGEYAKDGELLIQKELGRPNKYDAVKSFYFDEVNNKVFYTGTKTRPNGSVNASGFFRQAYRFSRPLLGTSGHWDLFHHKLTIE